MKNKKALVFGETKGLNKNLVKSHSKPSKFPRQYICSFCLRTLRNDAVKFKGIGACPKCFKLSQKLVYDLREQRREYVKRFEGKNVE